MDIYYIQGEFFIVMYGMTYSKGKITDTGIKSIKHRQSFITYNIILESVRISSLKRTLIV